MDRPTARRRRHAGSTGSVSVADLLARTTAAEKASLSAIQARAAEEANARAAETARAITAPISPVPLTAGGEPPASNIGEEPGTSNRLARTIAVAVVAMLVCGVVTAAAVLTNERPDRLAASPPDVRPTEITGATVVRPNVVNQHLSIVAQDDGQEIPTSDPDSALQPSDKYQEPIRSANPLPAPALQSDQPPAPTAADQIDRLIRDFYAKAAADPSDPADQADQAEAFELLGPAMKGDGLEGFRAGWRHIRPPVEIEELIVGEGGLVRVVVSTERLDTGTVLRTEQIMVVSTGPEPKIIRAQLLSAHRS